ncbi:MAG: hypothetical protein ACI4K7_05805 [Oscillospiraceae bacterium]
MSEHELKFESPSFAKRLKSMLGVDFYRLFHTPMFYIFLAIAAIIPAMILGTSGMDDLQTGEATVPMYTNTWQIVAPDTPLYVVNSMGEYANMNMVFIFGGIMYTETTASILLRFYMSLRTAYRSQRLFYVFFLAVISFLWYDIKTHKNFAKCKYFVLASICSFVIVSSENTRQGEER